MKHLVTIANSGTLALAEETKVESAQVETNSVLFSLDFVHEKLNFVHEKKQP